MNKLAKRIIAGLIALTFLFCLAGCNKGEDDANTLKVGAILVGDETEGYTLAHMNGMEEAKRKLADEGIKVEISYKKKIPESEEVATNASDLVASGCKLVITNSYGHQFNLGDVIDQNPDVNFVSMTGDLAAQSGKENYANAFTKIYESRYVSGVVAGLKLQELINQGRLTPEAAPTAFDEWGNIKIGYVGAFPYAEVVSGYTAFYLGIKSIVPNVAMTVKYTNSWFSEEREAAVAEYLMGLGCVIIGQHADSTGAPAAVEKAYQENNNLLCYSVGYNVSMLDAAPDVALTSSSNNWEVYYEYLFRAVAKGEKVATDWAEGYSQKAVGITELGTACAAGTQEYVSAVEGQIAAGTLQVFNTATFTVQGQPVADGELADVIPDDAYTPDTPAVQGGVFSESSLRSAPYFAIRIDGIAEVDSDYAE